MDEEEFRRLLDLFPVVRSRDYHYDSDPSRQSTSRPPQSATVKNWEDEWEDKEVEYQNDAFWEKLKLAIEKKVGSADAKRFCNAFKQVHHRLVYEELSLDAARNFINSTSSGERSCS